MKLYFLIALVCLSGCSWFHARKPPEAPPTEMLVNGAPAGSIVFIDGAQSGQAIEAGKRSQILDVAPGAHILEVRVGDAVVYRENTYVEAGQKRVITVLSGANRN